MITATIPMTTRSISKNTSQTNKTMPNDSATRYRLAVNLDDSDRAPWERQIRETWKAYEAFCCYRDELHNRSIRLTVKQLNKSHTLIAGWSRKWAWTRRADLYDEYLERQARAQNEQLVLAARKRMRIVGSLMLTKVSERLQQLDSGDLTPQMIPAFAKTGADLQMGGLDTPSSSSRTEITGPDGKPLPNNAAVQVVFVNGESKSGEHEREPIDSTAREAEDQPALISHD